MPDETLLDEILPIANDIDYASFNFYAYETNGKISLYVDHIDVRIEELFANEVNE